MCHNLHKKQNKIEKIMAPQNKKVKNSKKQTTKCS
jgi:hypothetical protein